MKKFVILLLFSGFIADAQPVNRVPITSDAVYDKCVSAVKKYLSNTIDKKNLDHYFDFRREYGYTIVANDLKIFDGREPKRGEILGYTIEFEIPAKHVINSRNGISFSLFVNPDMKVWFDPGWNGGLSFQDNIAPRLNLQPEDRSGLYINSMNQYIIALTQGKLLTEKQLLETAEKHTQGKKWREPEISRETFPPYSPYWEMIEDGCETCNVLQIKIDEPVILKTRKVTFVGL